MTVNNYIEIKKIPDVKDYKLAEDGVGFVIPGSDFLASISPNEPINYIALLRYKQGELRANHYHKVKIEHLIVVDGTLKVTLFLSENPSNRTEVEIESGYMLTIMPGCVHIVTAISATAAALELSPQKLELSDQYSV